MGRLKNTPRKRPTSSEDPSDQKPLSGVVKRRPGRPPKQKPNEQDSVDHSNNSALNATDTGAKPQIRKSGRTPKQSEATESLSRGDQSTSSTHLTQDGSTMENESSITEKGTTPGPTPKRRGRPPKKVAADTPHTSMLDVSGAIALMHSTPKDGMKRCGRQPNSINAENLPSPVAVGRGKRKSRQPRKVLATEHAEVDGDQSQSSMKANMSDSLVSRSAQKTGMRKCGRPKKVAATCICVHCELDMHTVPELRKHLMVKHHRIWSADNPAGVYNVQRVVKVLHVIHCLQCGKQYRNASTYRSHVKWCGRENETVTCDICKVTMKVCSFTAHMKRHQLMEAAAGNAEEKTVELEDEADTSADGKRSRKAARKAMSSFHDSQQLGSEQGDNGDLDDDPDVIVDLEESDEQPSDDEDDAESVTSSLADHRDRRRLSASTRPRPSQPLNKSKVMEKSGEDSWPYYSNDLPEYDRPAMLKESLQWYKLHECKDLFEELAPVVDDWSPMEVDSEGSSSLAGEVVSDGHGIASTGRVVWSTAWCPLPLTCGQFTVSYLAVSCHPTDVQGVPESWQEKGHHSSIQLWSCGQLRDTLSELQLSYTVNLDSGQIWHMKWCPTGTWQQEQAESAEPAAQRLGLLALACSTGHVHIVSMVHPKCLSLFGGVKTFRVQPCLSLVLCQPDLATPQCLSVDWSWKQNCGKICAGFSDGLVGVWALRSPSSLHQQILEERKRRRLPVIVFQADMGAITSVCFCPNSEWHMATGSVTRATRFWDLRDREQPLEEYLNFSRVTSMVWPLFWYSVCATSDHVNDYMSMNNVQQIWYGLEACHRCMLTHTACVWSVDYSPWLNALATCDSAGLLCTLRFSTLTGRMPDKKIVSTRMGWMLTDKKCLRREARLSKAKDDLSAPPEKSLHSVAWNPNYHSYRWLACGGYNGQVHIRKASVYKE